MSARTRVENKPRVETQAVPDGPVAASETHFVPDEAADATHVSTLPRFGRFRALGRLGAGAMGSVYRAQDDVLGRPVAIKALHVQGDASIRERFLREARAIGAVAHPNILGIYDAGTEGETPYLVMELAAGGSLRERMKAGPLPAEMVRAVGIQIGRALAAAHAAGIVHRDVKPANILATQGDVWKLADFGIARVPDSTLTVGGQFLGSPAYAAPESLRAGQFSPAADVYGLGATLYEALSGTPPRGDGDLGSMLRNLDRDPPAVHTRSSVPAPLGKAIMAALARDPAKRPSAEELARSLKSSEPEAKPIALAGARFPPRALLGAGIATAILAVIAAIVLFGASGRSEKAAGAPDSQPPSPPADYQANEPDPPVEQSVPPEATDQQPIFVDQYGNPVDEETARQILDQMERAARGEDVWGGVPPGRGRGRWKR